MATIAIVEDDEIIIDSLTSIFRQSGYVVLPYSDGKTAIDQITTLSPPPQAIVLDLLMPEVDGFDVLRTLRQIHKTLAPIIVLTNLSQDSDRERAFGLGADAFLVKSMCTADEIVSTVSQWVNKQHQYKES